MKRSYRTNAGRATGKRRPKHHRPSADLRRRRREARRLLSQAPTRAVESFVLAAGGEVLIDAGARARLLREAGVTGEQLDAALTILHRRGAVDLRLAPDGVVVIRRGQACGGGR